MPQQAPKAMTPMTTMIRTLGEVLGQANDANV
jgi:hypothetical protein